MAFHFSKRRLAPQDEAESGELNIVPYLDILMNLIIFMLLSMAGLATYGMVKVDAAASGERQAPELVLTVAVAKRGFFISTTGAEVPARLAQGVAIPAGADGLQDFDALNLEMAEIKARFPRWSSVIIEAEADTDYGVLVATLDATRETKHRAPLFPDVTLLHF